MRAGKQLHRFGQVRVTGDASVVVAIGAHEVGQDLGVTRVGLGARDVVALAVASGGQRVDGEDLIVRSDQRGHDEAPILLNADDDRFTDIVIVA